MTSLCVLQAVAVSHALTPRLSGLRLVPTNGAIDRRPCRWRACRNDQASATSLEQQAVQAAQVVSAALMSVLPSSALWVTTSARAPAVTATSAPADTTIPGQGSRVGFEQACAGAGATIESKMTFTGCGLPDRVVSNGSSSTVLTPTAMASVRHATAAPWREPSPISGTGRCGSRSCRQRHRGLSHLSGVAVSGEGVRCRLPRFAAHRSSPRFRSRAGCAIADSGFGSAAAMTTRATPASISASLHGGVRPWWSQGSSVTYTVAPWAAAPACFRATTSAWSLPGPAWKPSATMRPPATMTQPTCGLGAVRPRAAAASSRARAMNFSSDAAASCGRFVLGTLKYPPLIRTVTVGPGVAPGRAACLAASRTRAGP